MRQYCEGSECSKRENCLLHKPILNECQEYLDWSTYGSGHYWSDETGNHAEVEHCCGDKGKFKHFEPITENLISIHDVQPTYYVSNLVLPKEGSTHSDKCFTQECIEKIIDNLKKTKGINIIKITNSETEDVVTFEVNSSIL